VRNSTQGVFHQASRVSPYSDCDSASIFPLRNVTYNERKRRKENVMKRRVGGVLAFSRS